MERERENIAKSKRNAGLREDIPVVVPQALFGEEAARVRVAGPVHDEPAVVTRLPGSPMPSVV